MVALATKVNSSWTGLTFSTLCPIILPFSTKKGFPNEVAVLLSIICAAAVCSDIAVPPAANIPAVITTARDMTFKNNLRFILLIVKELIKKYFVFTTSVFSLDVVFSWDPIH
jgi:uncharacterized membrane protein required for colicin V production